mgnify:FL=1
MEIILKSFNIWREKHLSARQFLLLLAFLAGIGAALAAQFLKWLISEIEFLLTYQFDTTRAQWLYLVYPIIGILLTALFIKYVVKDNIGHGITKILYAISRQRGHIRQHNCWSSVIASSITIGFGGSVGAESPVVLTGAAIGSTLGNTFKLDHRTLMILVGCGASAAIAGIFKAPIAGVVFTLEVLMLDMTMSSIVPLLISALTATCVTYFLTGTEAMFNFHLNAPFVVERIPTSILLGIVCGLLSLYFTRAMSSFEQVFGRINNLYYKVALGGITLAILIYFFPLLYGEGYETISHIINAKSLTDLDRLMNNSLFYGHPELLLLYLSLTIIVKVFATTATNGGGGCGGTFAPSLFLGCLMGFVFSCGWNEFHPFDIYLPFQNYALLGMAGLMSGVFHAPLLGVFLIAELTGGYDMFVPLLIVSAVSFITINIFERHSIYAIRLARRGDLLTHHIDQSILTLMSLESVIEKERPTFSPDTRLGQIVQTISTTGGEDFAVTDRKGTLLGIINLRKIRKFIFRSELYRLYTAEQLMQQPAAVLNVDDTMQTVMDKFQDNDAEVLPVLRANHTFAGFVSKTHVYSSYRQLIKDFSQE